MPGYTASSGSHWPRTSAACRSACVLKSSKGVEPEASLYSVTPSEKRSERPSSFLPIACSGEK